MPPGDKTGRISLAMAPSRPDTVYALVSNRLGSEVLGVYRSRNGGERWQEVGRAHFAAEGQSSYNNAIAVHPDDPDIVVCGLNDIHISRDGGATWRRASRWDAAAGAPQYVHSDQHAIVLPGGDRIYAANDGGVAVSEDLGETWRLRVRGLVNTMFYDIDVAPTNGRIFGGGAQDNGTLVTGVTDKEGDFLHVLGGDGAWMVFDPENENHVFASRSDIHIFRHTAAQHWSQDFWEEISPKGMKPSEHHQNAIAVLAIDPAHPRTLWVGSRRLWRTTRDGREWQPVSPELDGSPITAIEIPAGRARSGVGRHAQRRHLPQPGRWRDLVRRSFRPRDSFARDHAHRKPSAKSLAPGGDGRRHGRGAARDPARTARGACASPAERNSSRTYFCRRTAD